PTKESGAPSGRPNFIYDHPELWNYEDVGLEVPDNLREVATISARDLQPDHVKDIFDVSDPFGLAEHKDLLEAATREAGCFPITMENKTDCFQALRLNQTLREEMGFE
ncbi:hypothetical protein HDU99_008973, partial [Rhizoclosmatium hyalinum]